MKFLGKTILILIALIIAVVLQYITVNLLTSREIKSTKPIITANPVDLSQLSAISKFRSCEGHDFSGYNSEGKREKNRSMKHYFNPIPEFENTNNKLTVFAPFDGKIVNISPDGVIGETVFSNERGHYILIKHQESDWHVGLFHINPIENIKEGLNVKAGDLIGYADIKNAGNFDLVLQYKRDSSLLSFITTNMVGFDEAPFFQQFDSFLNYLSEDVKAEYKSYGIDAVNTIISKEDADNTTCDFNKYNPERNYTQVDKL